MYIYPLSLLSAVLLFLGTYVMIHTTDSVVRYGVSGALYVAAIALLGYVAGRRA